MRAPTEKEFIEWLDHPVSRQLRDVLHARREELRQQWEGGSFTDYATETLALVNVGNIGTCKGYAFVTDLTYEQFIQELEDEREYVGTKTSGGSSADPSV